MTKRRKKVLLSSVLFLMLLYYKDDYEYHEQYEILDDDSDAYARYRDGLIYIGDKCFLDQVDVQEGDVLIEDQREYLLNPNLKVYSSYSITDKEARNDIIEVLQHYEDTQPTPWNRSSESMRMEWLLHNLCYDIGYQRDRTTNVDFNNADEEAYDKKILKKILKI